jgi:hypothetical protein
VAAEAVAVREAIAERVAVAYRANPHVTAVLLAGSVTRGLADELLQADVATLRRGFDHRRVT